MNEIRPRSWTNLSSADFFAALAEPPDKYRPVPWLAWTGDLDWPVLRGQLADMLDKGIREFFLFPIYGMELPYMSAAYWERVGETLAFCRDNGMKCWIYDEYNWPSGICGGQVLRDHPEARARLLWLRETDPDAEPQLSPELDEVRHGNGVIWGIGTAMHVGINSKGCDWLSAMPGYLDVLDMEANRHFIEYTHDRYHLQAPDMFPGTIPGFFTDEPAFHCRYNEGWTGLPFTPDLFAGFADEYGYDLRDRLTDLLVDSPSAPTTRCHFWAWLAQRFGEAYAHQQRQWCDRHDVALTGHALGEETLIGHVGFYGDIWEVFKHFTIPGIDLLLNADGFTYPYANGFIATRDRRGFHLTCKFIHGVVIHSGGREMMSEAYGVCDWGLNLFRQKRGFNYQVALGVTLFNDNSLITSIADFRKYAISGKYFTQPWWSHYKQYADYNARVVALHAEAEPVSEVAVLFPRSTVWARTDARAFDAKSWAHAPEDHPLTVLDAQFYDLLDELIREQWPFDFIFEPVLAEATVTDGQLLTPHARYRAIIVPSAAFLPRACIDVLDEFARAGGTVIFTGELPGMDPQDQTNLSATVSTMLSAGNTRSVDASGGAVCEALSTFLQRSLVLSGDNSREFVSSWRRLAGSDIFFLANMAEEPVDVSVSINIDGPLLVHDPDTLESFQPQMGAAGNVFDWHFEPWQGYLFITGEVASEASSPEADRLPPAPRWLKPRHTEVLDGDWDFSLQPANMLRLSVEARPDPDNCGAAQGWQHDRDPDGWIRPEEDRLAEPISPAEAPWYWLRAYVSCGAGSIPRLLVADNADFLEVYVNGQAARQMPGEPLWTDENVHFDVAELFVEGDNFIHVRALTSKYNDPRISPMTTTPPILQPVVLTGDFLVTGDSTLKAWSGRIRTDAVWEEQGLPHFAGIGTYRRTLQVAAEQPTLLHLPACHDAVEVFLNGTSCGTRAWYPYIFNLTPQLRPGENQLEISIHNTLGNIITATYGGRRPANSPTSGLTAAPRLLILGD